MNQEKVLKLIEDTDARIKTMTETQRKLKMAMAVMSEIESAEQVEFIIRLDGSDLHVNDIFEDDMRAFLKTKAEEVAKKNYIKLSCTIGVEETKVVKIADTYPQKECARR